MTDWKLVRYSRWTPAWFCIKCHGRLSNHSVMYSNGMCPLCGYKDRQAGTIVETYFRPFRWKVYRRKGWLGWILPRRREGEIRGAA